MTREGERPRAPFILLSTIAKKDDMRRVVGDENQLPLQFTSQ